MLLERFRSNCCEIMFVTSRGLRKNQKVSGYSREMSQSHTADQQIAPNKNVIIPEAFGILHDQ